MSRINASGLSEINLDVIKEDIEQGKVCSTEECVIAQTLKRLGHAPIEVMIDRTYVGNFAYWHDRELIDYIQSFDKREIISPAKFIIYNIDNRKASPKLGRPKKVSETTNETGNSETVGGSSEIREISTDTVLS